jgi:acyl-CoA synthetase (AMP-forming)/AMP-acid ligase II
MDSGIRQMESGGLLAALRRRAQVTPGKTALVVQAEGSVRQFSYAELWEESGRWGRRWASSEAEPGEVVFIVLRHGWEAYAAFLGAMRARLLPSFLPFPTPKQDAQLYWASHRQLFDRVRAGLLLTYEENVAALDEANGKGPVFSIDRFLQQAEGDLPLGDPAPDVPAFLQHSSGTTGLKKGVVITWRQLELQVHSYAAAIGFGPEDKVASWLPLYHDMGLITGFLAPLGLGATVISLDPFEWVARPAMLFEAVEAHAASLCWLPNFAFAHLVRTAEEGRAFDLSSIRAFIDCSEPCKAETLERFLDCFGSCGVRRGQLQTCYAMAETVFAVTQTPIGQAPKVLEIDAERFEAAQEVVEASEGRGRTRRLMSCGEPIAGIDVRIRAVDGRAGEIEVQGDFVFDGYYANPEATAEAFVGGWYRTGDIGFLKEGELYVCGRRKEMLIVHGRNYYASDIEDALTSTPGVKPGRAVVFAVFDEVTGSEEAIAMVETDEAGQQIAALKRAVKKAVYDRLELTLRGVEILAPGRLVKTTSGKISREENRRRYLEGRNA